MIAHVSVPVSNFKKAKAFYDKILPIVGYKNNMNFDGAAGYMEGGHTSFWIVEKKNDADSHRSYCAEQKSGAQIL